MKNFFLAVGILAGTIIGAGVFSLPYIFTKLGVLTGLFYLVVFSLIFYLVHIKYAEVLRSEGHEEHHFSYFARKYFSRFWGWMASGLVVFELLFGLTIYLILSKGFVELMFGNVGLWVVILFWFLSSILIFWNARWMGWAEVFGGLGIVVITLFVFLGGGDGHLGKISLVESLSFWEAFLPFGPLLFAFAGRAAVSKVVGFYRELPKGKKFPLKKAIFWGTFLPVFVYILFIFGVLRLVPGVSPDTLGSLGSLPQDILYLIGAVGLLVVWTSYFVLGSNVYDILKFDVFRRRGLAGLIAFFGPLVLYLLGLKSFIFAISITGGLFLALESMFVVSMWIKIKDGAGIFLMTPLYLVFILSVLYQVFLVFK